jgi:hypothetical protein
VSKLTKSAPIGLDGSQVRPCDYGFGFSGA